MHASECQVHAFLRGFASDLERKESFVLSGHLWAVEEGEQGQVIFLMAFFPR